MSKSLRQLEPLKKREVSSETEGDSYSKFFLRVVLNETQGIRNFSLSRTTPKNPKKQKQK